jgi:hypothetical protein
MDQQLTHGCIASVCPGTKQLVSRLIVDDHEHHLGVTSKGRRTNSLLNARADEANCLVEGSSPF